MQNFKFDYYKLTVVKSRIIYITFVCFSQLPSDCTGSEFNNTLFTIAESRSIILLSSSLPDDISYNSSSLKINIHIR